METKKIIQALKHCHNLDECEDCEYNELGGFCEELLKRDAAKRLEELEKKNAKLKAENDARKLFCEAKDEINEDLRRSLISMEQQLSEKQSEWISVEDERKPDDGETCIVMSSTNCIYSRKYEKGGFPKSDRIRYWMHKPALPKPKEPTFKDVFFEKFPKAIMYNDGIPLSCRASIFGGKCSLGSTKCFECWNQPYFETEEEGGEE